MLLGISTFKESWPHFPARPLLRVDADRLECYALTLNERVCWRPSIGRPKGECPNYMPMRTEQIDLAGH
jgi:hypothetical protein